jgi:hypothetical protein
MKKFLKMNKIIQHIFLAVIIVLPGFLSAQDGGDGGFDQTQIITGDRTLTVQKAYKISDLPRTLEIKAPEDDFEYVLIPKRPVKEIELETIPPAKVKVRKPLEKLYHGFVKAGAGTFATPYLDAYYTSTRDRDIAYGARVHHFSSNDGINREVAFSGFSRNKAELWGKKIFKKQSVELKAGFTRDVWHYYGFDPEFYDFDIEKKDYRQRFNIVDVQSTWRSYYRDSSRVNHVTQFDFYALGDRYESSELGFNLESNLESFRGNQYYTLETGLDFISYKAGELSPFNFIQDTTGIIRQGQTTNNAIFKAVPRILITHRGLRAMVGIGIYGRFQDQADFHAFPDAEVSYSLFNNIFIPYAGITGKVIRNSYRNFSDLNPFILSNFQMANSIERYKMFAGIRGTVSDNISFNAGIEYSKVDDRPLFVNDTLFSAENRFEIIYDEVKTFTIQGELTYQVEDKWDASVFARIYSYSTDIEKEAWHLPSHEIGLNANYNLFNKFYLGAELTWIGKRYVKSLLPVESVDAEPEGFSVIELDPYLDLSLSAEYRYTKRLSVFLEANNLTATKYDIYYRFPAQRVFILGGLKYAF